MPMAAVPSTRRLRIPPAVTPANSSWLAAKATWYGARHGAGPDDNGGACGFKNVNLPPFSAMTSCGNEPLFKDGKGCGSCYQIRCLRSNHPACSGVPETVIITDMNYYPVSPYHFDLSGTAFGAMAKDGRNDELRNAGIIDMQFRRYHTHLPILPVTIMTIVLSYQDDILWLGDDTSTLTLASGMALQGAVPVPGAGGDVPCGEGVEPVLHGNPGGIREPRRRCETAGNHGVTSGRRQRRRDGSNGGVGAHEGVMGIHLEDGCPAPHAGAILVTHH
uniref:Expansin-like EG45 domain-containing protein n=1 Tax=Triticum urartu TaxID=4572 RepID=A0A8R7TQ29_TRIUA